MPSLADVFRVLNRMRDEGVVAQYAVGGATAVLFYAEPTRTYDLDVFVTLEAAGQDVLAPLSRVYEWARGQGFGLQAEHLLIAGVPVQLLPAYNPLVEAALATARFTTTPVSRPRVVDPEHLVAWPCRPAAHGGARGRGNSWRRAPWTGNGCETSWPPTPSRWSFLTMLDDRLPDEVRALLERKRAWHRAQAAAPLQRRCASSSSCNARICRSSLAGVRSGPGSGRGT